MEENNPLDYDKDEWLASLKVGDVVCDCRYVHSKIDFISEDRKTFGLQNGPDCAYQCISSADHKEHWIVYIVRCKDKSLYTGITNNLHRRIEQHTNGIGAKYTKGRVPVKLVFSELTDSKSAALKREAAIKKLSRKEKLKLIKDNK